MKDIPDNSDNTEDHNYELPKFAVKGSQLPRRKIYATLRSIWLEETGLSNKELATALNVTPQSCSTMATGSDRRVPPMWVILRLCHLLDRYLIVDPDSVRIRKCDNVE